jgi:hypothetical protein
MDKDQKYLDLMSLYKRVRRNPSERDRARGILNTAIELGKRGVSSEAKEAVRYI